jgi:uncharacterized protein
MNTQRQRPPGRYAVNKAHLVLTTDQLHNVQEMLRVGAPGRQAMAFGSRVRFDSESKPLKPHADLDIALTGVALPPHAMFALRDAFSQSDLPFRVDVLMKNDLPEHWLDAMAWFSLATGT